MFGAQPPATPSPDPRRNGGDLADCSFDRAREICLDPNGATFHAACSALGTYRGAGNLDAGDAHALLRSALRQATPEIRATIVANLRQLTDDEQHPHRRSNVALLIYDTENDPVTKRILLTENLGSSNADIVRNSVMAVRSNFEQALASDPKRAVGEIELYAPDLFEIITRHHSDPERQITLAVERLFEKASRLDRKRFLESALLYGERVIKDLHLSDAEKLSRLKLVLVNVVTLDQGHHFSDLIDLALNGEYLRSTTWILKSFGREVISEALDRVQNETGTPRSPGLQRLFVNLGTSVLPEVEAWITRDSQKREDRLPLALDVIEAFGATFLSRERSPEIDSGHHEAERRRLLEDRVAHQILTHAEHAENYHTIERARAIRTQYGL